MQRAELHGVEGGAEAARGGRSTCREVASELLDLGFCAHMQVVNEEQRAELHGMEAQLRRVVAVQPMPFNKVQCPRGPAHTRRW